MKRTASAVEISAANSAARARPPSQGGSTSAISVGRASSALARAGRVARAAMPRTGGMKAKRASTAVLARTAVRAACGLRAPYVFWTSPGETMNEGTKVTRKPRRTSAGIAVRLA